MKFAWFLVTICASLTTLCIAMLHRNQVIFQCRGKANARWHQYSKLVIELLRMDPKKWSYRPDLHSRILEEDNFFEIFEAEPGYVELLYKPKYWMYWKYETLFSDYEIRLKKRFEYICSMIKVFETDCEQEMAKY